MLIVITTARHSNEIYNNAGTTAEMLSYAGKLNKKYNIIIILNKQNLFILYINDNLLFFAGDDNYNWK